MPCALPLFLFSQDIIDHETLSHQSVTLTEFAANHYYTPPQLDGSLVAYVKSIDQHGIPSAEPEPCTSLSCYVEELEELDACELEEE